MCPGWPAKLWITAESDSTNFSNSNPTFVTTSGWNQQNEKHVCKSKTRLRGKIQICFPSAHTAFWRTPSLLASYRRDLHSSPLAHFDLMSDFYVFMTHEVSPCNCLSPASTCLGSRWLTRCIDICYHLTSLLTWENCPDNRSKISQSVGCGMLVIRRGWMTLRRKPRLYVAVILQRKKVCLAIQLLPRLQPVCYNRKYVLLSAPWIRHVFLCMTFS